MAFQDAGFAFQGTGLYAFQNAGLVAALATPELGGSAKPKRHRRYYVEIDGQYFEVSDQAEAEALLRRALSAAETIVADSAERNAKRIKRGRRIVDPSEPTITSSPELRALVDSYRAEIDSVYRRIAVDAEIRELMRLKLLEDDDEDALFVLLH